MRLSIRRIRPAPRWMAPGRPFLMELDHPADGAAHARHGLRDRIASLHRDGEPASRRDPTRRGREVTVVKGHSWVPFEHRSRFNRAITAPGGSGPNVLLHDALAAIVSGLLPQSFRARLQTPPRWFRGKARACGCPVGWFKSRPRSRVKRNSRRARNQFLVLFSGVPEDDPR